jgi:hypothetical protein
MPENRLGRSVGPGGAEADGAVSVHMGRIGRARRAADLDGAVHKTGNLGFRPACAGATEELDGGHERVPIAA